MTKHEIGTFFLDIYVHSQKCTFPLNFVNTGVNVADHSIGKMQLFYGSVLRSFLQFETAAHKISKIMKKTTFLTIIISKFAKQQRDFYSNKHFDKTQLNTTIYNV